MIIAQTYLLAAAAISLLSICNPTNAQSDGTTPTNIQGIRLVNGALGNHMGRLEVMYNGTWGTVCDTSWSFPDANVACRMLGYENAVCEVSQARFGRAATNVPIWMDRLLCSGSEDVLDQCSFRGWGINSSCTHRDDAGVICEDLSLTGVPDVRLVESTTTSLTIGWRVPKLPEGIQIRQSRYRINFQSSTDTFTRVRIFSQRFSPSTAEELTYTIPFLDRDTEYTIQIRAEVRYSQCNFNFYMNGNYSDPVVFRTNNTLKQSNIRARLVPPNSGFNFMGRVEVFYNGSWGTVCDDFFSTAEANVICGMLNYTEGSLCTVRGAGFGRGEGRIWLDNVNCNAGDEILEDCNFNPWGINNCDHGDDVGVICRPNDDNFLGPVENFTISHVTATSITVRWNRYRFPSGVSQPQFQIQYLDEFFGFIFPRAIVVPPSQNEFTLTRLQFGREYNISIRPAVAFSQCRFNRLFGAFSDEVSAVTQETAPTGPPTSFHVVVLNSTAVEVQFDLPFFELRNGIIRGYKVFVDPADGGEDELVFDVSGNTTSAYIINGLKPATAYIFSILAYTVADGPRSIHLTAITNPVGFDPLIVRFGINGNGLDKETRFTFQRDLHIHCSPSHSANSTVDWFFSNGTKVGNNDRNIREGHYANGTAVLQIASDRRLSYCDAGVYTCVVNTSDKIEKKDFTLVINTTPPPPSQPTDLRIKSDSITIGWNESLCNGGHQIDSFTIQYLDLDARIFGIRRRTVFVRNIDPKLRNYTITGLTPDTTYRIGIQAVGVERRGGAYSPFAIFITLPPAPSAPRDVTVKLIRPLLVEVRWRVPAVRNGLIVQYTIYAIPLIFTEPTRTKRQTEPTVAPKTITKVFPGSARAGNITLEDHSVTYQFRVSASSMSGETPNEGELSSITVSTTVFIPEPGLPTPVNLISTDRTNSSVTLLWDYPPPPVETIKSFLITYSAQVDWRSPAGTLVRFVDSGQATTTGTSFKVSQLIPGTSYLFKVSANTEKGRGADVSIVNKTDRIQSNEERLAFFQLRIGPIRSCVEFMDVTGNTTEKLLQVRKGLAEELTHICPSCGLTFANFKDNEFSCRGGLTNYIVYRARIVGTDVYSAPGLVSLMQTWVTSGTASISVQSTSRLHLDPTCRTSLDTLKSPDCSMVPEPDIKTTEQKKPEVTTSKPEDIDKGQSAAAATSAGEVGGIIVGALIVILLVVLIVVLSIFVMRRWKPKVPGMRNGNDHSPLDEDKTPFADIGSNQEGLENRYFAEKPNAHL